MFSLGGEASVLGSLSSITVPLDAVSVPGERKRTVFL